MKFKKPNFIADNTEDAKNTLKTIKKTAIKLLKRLLLIVPLQSFILSGLMIVEATCKEQVQRSPKKSLMICARSRI